MIYEKKKTKLAYANGKNMKNMQQQSYTNENGIQPTVE